MRRTRGGFISEIGLNFDPLFSCTVLVKVFYHSNKKRKWDRYTPVILAARVDGE